MTSMDRGVNQYPMAERFLFGVVVDGAGPGGGDGSFFLPGNYDKKNIWRLLCGWKISKHVSRLEIGLENVFHPKRKGLEIAL